LSDSHTGHSHRGFYQARCPGGMCKDRRVKADPNVEVDDDGQVIVSFDVFSATPIDVLAPYLRESKAPSDEFHYDLGTTTFEESISSRRADRLETTIVDYIDRLAAVPRDLLHGDAAVVRLFVTLPSGAETIHAKTIKRLAEVNATIWIDA